MMIESTSAKTVNVLSPENSDEIILSPSEQIQNRRTKELVLAFCGPLGSGVSNVARTFIECLEENDYTTHYVKVSKFIEEIAPKNGYKINSFKNNGIRIEELQNGGNHLRKKFGSDILAQLTVKDIAFERNQESIKSKKEGIIRESKRIAYIIESLKHPEEVQLLRSVYGNMFYIVGVLCAHHVRCNRLQRDKKIELIAAVTLMERDESEEEKYGQQLKKTLQYADFFVRNNHENINNIKSAIKRYIDLILGKPIITPTKHEYAMYMAQSAALRSACLSRQVGAAILNSKGEIIATGRNDVPKAGGGLYTIEDKENDYRCAYMQDGKCFNDEYKKQIKEQIKKILSEEINEPGKVESISNRISKETRLKDLLEFSKSVHAEMDAIISAINVGNACLKDSTLYTTTFPCHSCARHIIAAGIKEVYYIEPFEKSLALDLHNDSIVLEPSELEKQTAKVVFQHFEGVAPRQYINLFCSYTDRKENGTVIKKNNRMAIPVIPMFLDSYLDYETRVITHLNKLGMDK